MFLIFYFQLIAITKSNSQLKFNKDLLSSTSIDSAGISLKFNKIQNMTYKDELTDLKRPLNHKNIVIKKDLLNRQKLLLSSGFLILSNIAIYQPFRDTWWTEERGKFHFYRGWRRTKGYWDFGWDDTLYGHIDKLGHFYSSRLLSDQLFYICRWIGFSEKSSKIISPLLSSTLMLEIEIYDGFFQDWGFSLADFTANELGAYSSLINDKFPIFDNFKLKFSYFPSSQPKNEQTFIKDYAGMTYWLSYDIHTILPDKIKNYYPEWLGIALGYSITKQTNGKIELFLSPDINWEKIPIGNSKTSKYFKKVLNYVHFPCFTLRILPYTKFHPVYF